MEGYIDGGKDSLRVVIASKEEDKTISVLHLKKINKITIIKKSFTLFHFI